MKERIAIVDGLRTPFVKAGTLLSEYSADDLGAIPVRELMARVSLSYSDIDEVIIGNVAQPSNAANIGRVIALKSGFPNTISAYTVHRNCASGFESISSGAVKILAGEAECIVAGGTESMSNIPFLYSKKMKSFFEALTRAKTISQKLSVLTSFRLHFLTPTIGLVDGLTDPVCNLIMGLTAENLAKEFVVSRHEQDDYALQSTLKTVQAVEARVFDSEITPVPSPVKMDELITHDFGFRTDQTMQALEKLRPYFDKKNGSVTVGNSCPVTDGAAAVIVMSETKAKSLGIQPLGYLRDFAYAGLEPHRMGLGPVYATHAVFEKSGLTLSDIDLVEMNEAFAVQIIANLKAFESKEFGKKYLGRTSALGKINMSILNVNGGAIGLGHPVGTTGTRLVITLLHELRRRGLKRGLATLCIGGGQGGSFILESE